MVTDNPYIGSPDHPRTIAIVSYITFIGWLIAYFGLYRGNKSPFSAFHLRQALCLHLISLILRIAYSFNIPSFPFLDIVIGVLGIGLFVLWLNGFIHALNGKTKPLPIIGIAAQKMFRNL